MNLDQLTTSIETRRQAADRRRAGLTADAQAILGRARRSGRDYLTADESATMDALLGARDAARAEADALDDHLAECRHAAADELRIGDAQRTTRQTAVVRPGANRVASLSVGRNERTYRPDDDPHGVNFLRDVGLNFMTRDPSAGARLERHMIEERAERPGWSERSAGDSTTSSFVGLVVPQYLTDMYAPSVAPMRPFADNCTAHDLPANGMTVNIALVTTPSSVGLVATELPAGNVSAQSINDTLLTENVQTFAGQQTVSRQAIERGAGIEQLTMSDLMRRLATVLDSTLINQTVTGLSALGTGTAVTGATTQQQMYPLIYGANSLCEQALYGIAVPDLVIMHPRRWNWMCSSLGSTWPLIGGANMPAQSGGIVLTNDYGSRVRGLLPNGLKIVVDGGVPTTLGVGTNQDEIYVTASAECHLFEDPNAPVLIRAEQPKAAQLGILYVVYEYAAYTFRRFTGSVQKLAGTGLVAPSGF